ncbi:NPCBM/NEW2 domain-containing protein [Streptosporangium oxazolinicum]
MALRSSETESSGQGGEGQSQSKKQRDPAVKAAIIAASATSAAAILTVGGSVFVGLLQYQGPGSKPGPTPTVTVTVTQTKTVAADPPDPGPMSPSPVSTRGKSLLEFTPLGVSELDFDQRELSRGSAFVNGVEEHVVLGGELKVCGASLIQEYNLGRVYRQLNAVVGLADSSATGTEVEFIVSADGKEVGRYPFEMGAPLRSINVPTVGKYGKASRLTLKVVKDDCKDAYPVWIKPTVSP